MFVGNLTMASTSLAAVTDTYNSFFVCAVVECCPVCFVVFGFMIASFGGDRTLIIHAGASRAHVITAYRVHQSDTCDACVCVRALKEK